MIILWSRFFAQYWTLFKKFEPIEFPRECYDLYGMALRGGGGGWQWGHNELLHPSHRKQARIQYQHFKRDFSLHQVIEIYDNNKYQFISKKCLYWVQIFDWVLNIFGSCVCQTLNTDLVHTRNMTFKKRLICKFTSWILHYKRLICKFTSWILHYKRLIGKFTSWILHYKRLICKFTSWILHHKRLICMFTLWILHYKWLICKFASWPC